MLGVARIKSVTNSVLFKFSSILLFLLYLVEAISLLLNGQTIEFDVSLYAYFNRSINLIYLVLIISLFCFYKGRFDLKILIISFALACSVFLAMSVVSPISAIIVSGGVFLTYIFFVDIVHKIGSSKIIWKSAKIYFLLTTLLPLIVFFLTPRDFVSFMTSEGNFKGIFSSRTTYGYAAVITFVMFFVERKGKWWFWCSLSLFGCVLSESRVSFVTIFIIVLYSIWADTRIKLNKTVTLIIALGAIITPTLLVILFTRPEEAFDFARRFQLLQTHWAALKENIWFGMGGEINLDYLLIDGFRVDFKPSPAHNFVLESGVAFGSLSVFLWLWLLFKLYRKANKAARAFLIIFVCYGSVHNGFGLGVINSAMFQLFLVCLNCCNFFENRNSNRKLPDA